MADIRKTTLKGSYLTATLPATLHEDEITARLGFAPSMPEKGKYEWEGTINGHHFAIWDFKGARWSVYAPGFARTPLREIFPELHH
jgi:hypothetical protein